MRRLVPAVGVAVVLGSLGLVVLLALSLGDPVQPDTSGSGGPDRPRPQVDPAARQLLERAAAAPDVTDYVGTQFVAAWGPDGATTQVLDVFHSAHEGTTWRASGDDVLHSSAHAADPSILGMGAVGLMARHYSISTAGQARVAGRDVDLVEARRAGVPATARATARFWVDQESGLVLRREVYDAAGRTTRASAFVDVTVRPADAPADGADDQSGRAWPDTLDAAALQRMRHNGWDCPDELPGPLPLVDARRGGTTAGEGAPGYGGTGIVHLSYADGISSISVFQQRGTLDRGRLSGYQREKAGDQTVWVRPDVPRRVVWSSGGTVYTVVADAPQRTVDRAVIVLHDRASQRQGDPMDRLGRGLDRVASWFNPFE